MTDRTGDNDITTTDNLGWDDDDDPVLVFNDGPYYCWTDDHGTKHLDPLDEHNVRAVYDAAAAVLGTDNTAAYIDALRAAYIDAHAVSNGNYVYGPLVAARDALCAALRTKETS